VDGHVVCQNAFLLSVEGELDSGRGEKAKREARERR